MKNQYVLSCLLSIAIASPTNSHASLYEAPGQPVVEMFPELFSVDTIPTESTAWRLLKETKIPTDWTFLAVPWTTLINFNQLHKLNPVAVKNSFTICQHINYRLILPILEKMGVKVLFTPHVAKGQQKWKGITILPFPHYSVHGIDPAPVKDILFSFIGAEWTHSVRKTITQLKHPNAYIKARKKWHWGHSAQEQKNFAHEYQSVLARSRFSICPRGTGPSTVRLMESLEALAIPVSVSDALVLPAEFDWSSCMIFVPESEAKNIIQIIEAISPEEEKKMRHNCRRAYDQFQKNQLISTVIHTLEQIKPWDLA